MKRREPITFMFFVSITVSFLMFAAIIIFMIKRNPFVKFHSISFLFYFATIAITISVLFLQKCKYYIKNDNYKRYQLFLSISFSSILLSLAPQLQGMLSIAPESSSNVFYITAIASFQIIHSLIAIVLLAALLYAAFSNTNYVDSFVYNVNPPNQLRFKLIRYFLYYLLFIWVIFLIQLHYTNVT